MDPFASLANEQDLNNPFVLQPEQTHSQTKLIVNEFDPYGTTQIRQRSPSSSITSTSSIPTFNSRAASPLQNLTIHEQEIVAHLQRENNPNIELAVTSAKRGDTSALAHLLWKFKSSGVSVRMIHNDPFNETTSIPRAPQRNTTAMSTVPMFQEMAVNDVMDTFGNATFDDDSTFGTDFENNTKSNSAGNENGNGFDGFDVFGTEEEVVVDKQREGNGSKKKKKKKKKKREKEKERNKKTSSSTTSSSSVDDATRSMGSSSSSLNVRHFHRDEQDQLCGRLMIRVTSKGKTFFYLYIWMKI